MRSSPLLLLAIVIAGFALAAVPLARLTAARPETQHTHDETAPSRDTAPGNAATETLLRVRFAHRPESLRLGHAGKTLAVFEQPTSSPVEASISLPLTDETCELFVEAAWAEGTPETALTVELEPSGHESRSATVWTDAGSVSEMMFFTWP